MRLLISFLVTSLFGIGLCISGMTNTLKVQGWLDVFGVWDPTLAFVMGGAIIPMALAWLYARGKSPVLAESFPPKPKIKLGSDLFFGSVLFGIGWGLSGLCPGPAIASFGIGGIEGFVFLAAMLIGIMFSQKLKLRLKSEVAKEV